MSECLIKLSQTEKYAAWHIPDKVMIFFEVGLACFRAYRLNKDNEKIPLQRILFTGLAEIGDNEYYQTTDMIFTRKTTDRLFIVLDEV